MHKRNQTEAKNSEMVQSWHVCTYLNAILIEKYNSVDV